MKIVVVNFRHYIRGGPDRYYFNAMHALEERGNTVIPWAFRSPQMCEAAYSKYFPQPCCESMIGLSPLQKVKATSRLLWNSDVTRQFRRLLREERPDLVYCIYLSCSITPRIIRIANSEFSLPVVYRLSDFHMFCPSYMFFRRTPGSPGGAICTECCKSPLAAVWHRCVHGSVAGSLVRMLQTRYNHLRRFYDDVAAFVCPSRLMADWLERSGIDRSRLHHIPTFATDIMAGDGRPGTALRQRPYILYFGRLSPEKGCDTLIRAFNAVRSSDCDLILAGAVEDKYRGALLSLVEDAKKERVVLAGHLSGDDLNALLLGSTCVVHPSLWFENTPNSVLEAFSAGKPVIAWNIGCMPELVSHDANGMLVAPGDVASLANAIDTVMCDAGTQRRYGENARRRFAECYTSESHLKRLLPLFAGLVNGNRGGQGS